MVDESRPPVWGLWNEALAEWFNPGSRNPYFLTKEDAQRRIPHALRQYNFGKWEIREYPLDDELELAEAGTPVPPPDRPGAASAGTASLDRGRLEQR